LVWSSPTLNTPHYADNSLLYVCRNISPALDSTREKPYPNGNGISNGDEGSGSSSDEEVKKSIIVEISPMVTYAGEVGWISPPPFFMA